MGPNGWGATTVPKEVGNGKYENCTLTNDKDFFPNVCVFTNFFFYCVKICIILNVLHHCKSQIQSFTPIFF